MQSASTVPAGAAQGNGRRACAGACLVLLLLGGTSKVDGRERQAPGSRSRAGLRETTVHQARQPAFLLAGPRRLAALLHPGAVPARDAWVQVESAEVVFGSVIPGESREVPGGIRVRVYAAGDWELRLVPGVPLHNLDRAGEVVPHSRIAWRGPRSGQYIAFGARGAAVARGRATGGGGLLVVIDLRLLLDPDDELGQYRCTFDVILTIP